MFEMPYYKWDNSLAVDQYESPDVVAIETLPYTDSCKHCMNRSSVPAA